ncbi:MAG: hypothetical protein AAGA28_03555 [Pseudomonadota bacterium]
MSERFDIRSGERGVIRLFRIDLPAEETKRFLQRDPLTGRWPVQQALGVEDLDETFVDIMSVDDLGEMGLAGYMTDGLGISDADIAEHRAQLDAVTGAVLVLLSRAFKGLAVSLQPRAPLRWIGTFREEHSPVQFDPLPTGGTEPAPMRARGRSNAAMSGRVAMTALLVIFAITALIIWIAA